ncbi:MAG TPA: hypothetical protein VFK68_00045 [Propionibacteriaceae bacterium]|nr:hypothetical protein [Propionibacteriaceae bacterium]
MTRKAAPKRSTPQARTKAVYARRRVVVGLVGFGLLGLVLALVVGVVVRWWEGSGIATYPSPQDGCVATVGGQTATLDLEQSYNAAIIAGVAVQRGLPPRAVSIALATALQESGLRNLDHGDRDSVGLFQQRPSQGWGTVAQIMVPQYSAGKFYDALVRINNWQTRDITEVAQAVQRSGVPDGYRKHVERAKVLASALSGETVAAFTCLATEPKAADSGSYVALLKATYGGTAPGTVDQGPPVRVDVTVAADATTWSVAAASQAWASAFGITRIAVAERSWHPSTTDLPLWASASATPNPTARTVSVTFG